MNISAHILPELLRAIFDSLDLASQFSMLLTCREWRRVDECVKFPPRTPSLHEQPEVRLKYQLHEAATRIGSTSLLSMLLKLYPLADYSGLCTAAIEAHQLPILQQLLRSIDVESMHVDLPTLAAQHGHLDILQWLCDAGYRCSMCTVVAAAGSGDVDVVTYLKDVVGPNLDDESICESAAAHGHIHIRRILLR
jgi:hypothetical protein